jgi:hypothetical protein
MSNPEPKQRVLVDTSPLCESEPVWVEGKVLASLATQFTAKVGKKVHFYFYKDKETTWKLIHDK